MLFVCLIDLCLFGFVGFLFLLMSGKGCGLWLWHSLEFSLTFFYQPAPGKPYKEPTITVKDQILQVVDKFTYLGSTLSRVVHIDMKSMPGLPKIVQHLADYVVVFGIEVESGLTQSWKCTKLWCCEHYCMHAKPGQFTNGMPKDWTTSIQAALKNF